MSSHKSMEPDLTLDRLRDLFYPEGTVCPGCQRESRFHHIQTRSAYGCQFCGHQVYPAKGTIFEGSTQPMKNWQVALRLVGRRPNITSRELAERVGVSYKTAWRMRAKIRSLVP